MIRRRSYLKLVGATAAATGTATSSACVMERERENGPENEPPDDPQGDAPDESIEDVDEPAEPDDDNSDGERIVIDYDQYGSPSEVYRIWTGNPSSYSFVEEPTYDGDTVLRCVVPEGDSWGSNATYWFPANGHGQPTSVYQRSMIYLDDDWWMDDGDVCRLWSVGLNTEAGDRGSGGRGIPGGDDGWSSTVAVANRDTVGDDAYNLGVYTYHVDQPGLAGELEVVGMPVHPGEWFELETHVRVNTMANSVANRDGEIRYWVDGDLAYERMDFRLSAVEEQAVEYAGPLVRYGGGETAPIDLNVFYDEHELVLDWTPEAPSYDASTFEDPERADAYDERLTVRNDGDPMDYSVSVDGEIVQSDWSQATYNEGVEIATDKFATVEATAAPHTVDGYFFDGEIVALSAEPEPLALWVSGDEVAVDDYPDVIPDR